MHNNNNTKVTRQQLYELVWSEPMTSLAKGFGISDTGLRKICQKMNIPLPSAGYWMKIKFGKAEKRSALPKDDKAMSEVNISPTSEDIKEFYGHLSKQNDLQKQIEQEMPEFLVVPERLNKPIKAVQNTKDYFSGAIDYTQLVRLKIDTLNIKVSKEMQLRALKIMDTLLKALMHRGHELTFRNSESHIKIAGEEIRIYLREKEKRIENEKSKYSFDKYIFQATGLLCFQFGKSYDHKEITEGKDSMEQQLSRIIAALEMAAAKEKEERIQRQKWNEEYDRKRKEELAVQQRKEKEIKDFNKLLSQADRFSKSRQIREYVTAMENKAVENQSLSEELREWIDWALDKADWLDPTIKKADTFLDESIT